MQIAVGMSVILVVVTEKIVKLLANRKQKAIKTFSMPVKSIGQCCKILTNQHKTF